MPSEEIIRLRLDELLLLGVIIADDEEPILKEAMLLGEPPGEQETPEVLLECT